MVDEAFQARAGLDGIPHRCMTGLEKGAERKRPAEALALQAAGS